MHYAWEPGDYVKHKSKVTHEIVSDIDQIALRAMCAG